MRFSFLVLVALFSVTTSAPAQVFDSPQAAKDDPDFLLQGEYADDTRGMQVIAEGDGEFRVKIYKEGLPGAGWDGSEVQEIEAGEDAVASMTENFRRVTRTSPTLGAKPPAGAVVLFDGSPESIEKHWRPGAKLTEDGLLKEGCTSVDTFGDYRIHLEFRLPFMPKARGQGRGNSGLYHQGRYETQILDSFGLEGKNNETGGIYEIRDPDLNLCLPPLVWQTYDVDFTAARFDDAGKKVTNAKITVRLNGVVVHRDVELPRGTRAAPVKEGPEDGPIYLQNHGNPVRFRNIWVKPRDVAAEARRPIIPGYERFHADLATPEGGRLLLGELNCVACHEADQALAEIVNVKQPPILDGVGKRVHAEWMVKFLSEPRTTKPGTTMPDLLAGVDPSERRHIALALTNFLVGEDAITMGGKRASTSRGEQLFHESGCVACHLPRNEQKANRATSVPLVGLDAKYSRGSLQAFLKDPLAVRPSGRMPQIDLGDDGWADVAQYLTGDESSGFGEGGQRPKQPNMKFALFHGSWSEMPLLDELEPVKTGTSRGLDIGVAGRSEGFALRFDGFLPIEKSGIYKFQLSSDDGSFLYINGKRVIDNDGVHPNVPVEGSIQLTAGVHTIRVEYFEKSGEEALSLNWAGPGIESGWIDRSIRLSRDETEIAVEPETVASDPDTFVFDPSLVDEGRKLFSSLGCAACHQRSENGRRIDSSIAAPALTECRPESGCLSGEPKAGVPNFELLDGQQQSLAAAVVAGPPPETSTAEVKLAHTMTSLNCFACHSRGSLGGPESDRNAIFVSTIPEMGDEGRLPPPLDGVGDKLRRDWLNRVVSQGDKSRPYMKTFMPKFGEKNAGHLAELFAKLDARSAATLSSPDQPEHRIVSAGRKMVGSKGLACVSCHTFGKFKTTGIQAIALDTMAQRIREDWFHRYLPDPQKYRPGTRMPTGYPDGKSTVTDVYDGDREKQIAAMWAFLEQGLKGGVPEGIASGMIELKPDDKPVIYRNFIEGVTPRGIAVGYPEKANLCWDANRLSLALIWQDRFIDASKHWVGRGQGNQVPLGGSAMKFESVAPVAALQNTRSPWPDSPPKERGYRFLGYRLDNVGHPTFRYRGDSFTVEDTPVPVPGDPVGTFRRTLKISPTAGPSDGPLFFRAASGDVQATDDRTFVVDGAITVRVTSAAAPIVRESNGHSEVLVPVGDSPTTIVQEIVW